MKYLYSILSVLLWSFLLGCQEHDLLEPNSNSSIISDSSKAPYILVKLNIDGDTGKETRDGFISGNEIENKIDNFAVLIFKSSEKITTEEQQNNATFVGYAIHNGNELAEVNTSDLNRKGDYIVKLNDLGIDIQSGINTRDNYYGVVIANSERILNEILGGLRYNSTFEYLANYISNERIDWSGIIIMSSIAYWQGEKGNPDYTKDPLILVPLDLNNIEWCYQEDLSDISKSIQPAANFYLQRLFAKIVITMDPENSWNQWIVPSDPLNREEIYIERYDIENVNLGSYLLQNTHGIKESLSEIKDVLKGDYPNRFSVNIDNQFNWVTWSIDQNYEDGNNLGSAYNASGYDTKEFYCNETTMPFHMMKRKYTPTLVMEAALSTNDGSDSYVIVLPGDPLAYNSYRMAVVKGIGVEFNKNIFPSGEFKYSTLAEAIPEDKWAEVSEKLNLPLNTRIRIGHSPKFKYYIPIRHYPDSKFDGHIIDNNNVKYDAGHLGRFGIVRNHCYEIYIKSLGVPSEFYTDPDPDSWDDPEVTGINQGEGDPAGIEYTINVMNWTQHEDEADIW